MNTTAAPLPHHRWRARRDLDAPYVTYKGLHISEQCYCATHFHLPVAEARLATVQDEADVYLLVNGGGTPQGDADMANAARVAQGA